MSNKFHVLSKRIVDESKQLSKTISSLSEVCKLLSTAYKLSYSYPYSEMFKDLEDRMENWSNNLTEQAKSVKDCMETMQFETNALTEGAMFTSTFSKAYEKQKIALD